MKTYASEFLGTALLLTIVAGSGFMGESLDSGNAAVALARSFTNTFVGIAPADVGGFVLAQVMAALVISKRPAKFSADRSSLVC